MIKFIIVFLISTLIFFPTNPSFSKEVSQKNLDKLVDKVSAKFARTFCNTSNFGISDQGAVEFAIGETKKEFSKNKLINLINQNEVNKTIVLKIENECQVYDFPVDELSKFVLNK
tara:strand:+ start:460 stop:804 length:345 start_codon:yes stop_codon:yes gene_type:complete